MADAIPASLKQADINLYKCANRAAQLRTAKPIIAYWCEYFVVNQILAKQLHNDDPEVLEYTTNLMDKLEQEYPNEEAITDDTTAQAYIEQFGQETLDRAQRVVKANKVTAQTAGTFDAAATFINLVQIWGAPDPENLQKIKYAKWNAARIYKAIKEGKDPNESNPKLDELEQQPTEADVGQLDQLGAGPKPVTLEDVPDRDLRKDSAGVSPASGGPPVPQDELVLPSAPPSAPGTIPAGYFDGHAPPQPPSPLSPPAQDPSTFGPPSGFSAPDPELVIPSPPSSRPGLPTSTTHDSPTAPAPPTFGASPRTTPAVAPPPLSPSLDRYSTTATPSVGITRPVIPQPAPPPVVPATMSSWGRPAQQSQPRVQGDYNTDDMAVMAAQKHAKWAISALNFEDVSTAVQELRKALDVLGAS